MMAKKGFVFYFLVPGIIRIKAEVDQNIHESIIYIVYMNIYTNIYMYTEKTIFPFPFTVNGI